ncbi:MAG: LacI family DNA-binding transcriptional regulator [Methyloligellaceae bacterium]
MNEQTRRKIQDTYDLLSRDTDTADNPVSQRCRILGVFVPQEGHSHADARCDAFLRDVQVMQDAAAAAGYGVLLGPYSGQGRTVADTMIDNQELAGVILLGSHIDDPIHQRLEVAEIPFILVHRMIDNGPYHCIGIDDEQATRDLTNYLLDKGYKSIGFLGGPEQRLPQQQKKKGFLAALADRGIEVNPDWIVNMQHAATESAAREAAMQLLSQPDRPRAILASTDGIAFGVLDAARGRGLDVPRDLAVAGFDDRDRAAYSTPPLTTIHVPWNEMARIATSQLIQLVEYGQAIKKIQVCLTTRLVVRRSA